MNKTILTPDIQKKLTDLICNLIAVDTSNPPGNEANLCANIENYFNRLNISITTYPLDSQRKSLVARIKGRSDKNILAFTGHMDVVPVSPREREAWHTPPFEPVIKNGRIYGRGSTDMKSGLATAMTALMLTCEKIKSGSYLPETDIMLIITCDEEDFMSGSKKLLRESFIKDIGKLIVCEPTSLKFGTSGAGRTYGELTITGQTGHGSRGCSGNVIHFASQFIERLLKEDFSDYDDPQFGRSFWQVLSINAGQEPGVVPDLLKMKIDARLAPDHRADDIRRRIESIIREMTQQTEYSIAYNVIDNREGWHLKNLAFREDIKKAAHSAAIPFEEICFTGTTDGSIFRRAGIECIIAGPGDLALAHRENESVSISECEEALMLYMKIIGI